MKPILEHLPLNHQSSFIVKHFNYAYYPTPWHYHPEYEIVLVTESTGKRFIGDHISDFSEGDLAFIGPNVPHLYRNDPAYYEPNSTLKARSIVVHFLTESFGKDLFNLVESEGIRRLFEKAARAMNIVGTTREEVSKLLFQMVDLTGFKRLIKLLEILEILSETTDYHLISSTNIQGFHEGDSLRINRVYEYVLQHFHEEIRLSTVADLANMSETAFSRYFKHRTHKSFSDFLIEFRLAHAAKLLIENQLSVSEIAYACGYNNISNFNRQFKAIYQKTPLTYKGQWG